MAAERIATRVQPGLPPIAPAFSPAVLRLVHGLLPLLLRFRLFPWLPAAITRIDVVNGDQLARCYHRFGRGEVRLILAFRHGEVDDPLLGLHLLGRDLPRRAARLGLPLAGPPHVHFLFDRGMPLWGGRLLGWLLSRLGGLSVHRGRHPDWRALRQSRQLVLEGRFPFAVAPEGATNGHGETIGPLEPGVAQLGAWCVQDLQRDGRGEEVLIVPIALQYVYARPQWDRLSRLMAGLEASIGLPPPGQEMLSSSLPGGEAGAACGRLRRIGEAFLDRFEAFYAAHPFPPDRPSLPATGLSSDPDVRIARLLDRALAVAEAHLDGRGAGTWADRCRRLEEAAWRRIHRDDLPPRHRLSPLERGLADWTAHEAALAEVHMRLAECFVAVSADYVPARPTFERTMETTLLLHDAMARVRGDRIPARPRLGARHGRITVGTPLSVSERWSRLAPAPGQSTRHAERDLIAALTEDIRRAFEAALI
jgi:1-acyl-sn-glycerol-3-phosphate acyltransferase